MKELKFRAWDQELKKMTKWEDLILDKSENNDRFLIGWKENKSITSFDHEQDLMQYTGLKDKNGKEIYEGDIVTFTYVGEPRKKHKQYELKTNKEKVGSIIYDDYDCCYYIEFLSLWKGMYDVELYKDLTYKNIRDVDNLEVIGNIFENPELIKE